MGTYVQERTHVSGPVPSISLNEGRAPWLPIGHVPNLRLGARHHLCKYIYSPSKASHFLHQGLLLAKRVLNLVCFKILGIFDHLG